MRSGEKKHEDGSLMTECLEIGSIIPRVVLWNKKESVQLKEFQELI